MSVTIKENQLIEAKVNEQVFTGRLPVCCGAFDAEELDTYVNFIQRTNKLQFDPASRVITCEPCLGMPFWKTTVRRVSTSAFETLTERLNEAMCLRANVMFTMRGNGTWNVEHNASELFRDTFDAWLLAIAKYRLGTLLLGCGRMLSNDDRLEHIVRAARTFDELQDKLMNKFIFAWTDEGQKSLASTLAYFPLPASGLGAVFTHLCSEPADVPFLGGGWGKGEARIKENARVLFFARFPEGVIDMDTFDSNATFTMNTVSNQSVLFEDPFGNSGSYKGKGVFEPKQVHYYYKQ